MNAKELIGKKTVRTVPIFMERTVSIRGDNWADYHVLINGEIPQEKKPSFDPSKCKPAGSGAL